MKGLGAAVLAFGVLCAGCEDFPVTQMRLQIDAFPPEDSLLGGVVDARDFVFSGEGEGSASIEPLTWSAGTPGRHYALWIQEAGVEPELAARFVIVEPPLPVKEYSSVTGGVSPQVRDYETTAFRGWVNTSCFNGPCGGVDLTTAALFDGAVEAMITREDDGASVETAPSDDVYVRGAVQPYARGTLRGTMSDPAGNPVPVVEISLLPQIDGSRL